MKTNTKCRHYFLKKWKKGNYILEATIIIPVFILGVMLLMSVVNVIRVCDSINYIACDEVEKMQGEGIYMPLTLGKSNDIIDRIKTEEDVSSVKLNKLSYKYSDLGKTDLIRVDLNAIFDSKSILDINENIMFKENIVGRAFTGLIQNKNSATEDEFLDDGKYHAVYVFPNEGTKYHSATCTYVSSKPYQCVLTNDIKKKYSPCKICGSKNLAVGSLVCCYKYGDAYHNLNCKSIDKYVIEMDEKDAKEKGYSPCSKCQGGN